MADEENNKGEFFTDATIEAMALEEVPETQNKAPKTRGKKKANKYDLKYDGQTGQLYKLFILDFFMRIITLGIYMFWGRTRLRKYLVSCFSLDGDRFEYTGTGGELFKGFLKVLPILAAIFIPLALAEHYPILALFYIPLIYCFGIAVYGAVRYRYSRTRWRGIRGYVGGSTIGFANLSVWRMFLNLISLGMLKPASDIAKHKYIMDNTYFGDVKAEFNGDSKLLFGAHLKSIFLALGTASVLSALLGGIIYSQAFAQSDSYNPPSSENSEYYEYEGLSYDNSSADPIDFSEMTGSLNTMALVAITYVLVLLAIIFIFPLCRSIYTAALMREKMRGLSVGDIKFMCTVGAMDIVKHKSMNIIILIFTLGFGYPFIVQRNMRFFMRHHIIMGDLGAFEANQGKDQGITTGEGLEGMLDMDVGIF